MHNRAVLMYMEQREGVRERRPAYLPLASSAFFFFEAAAICASVVLSRYVRICARIGFQLS